MPFPLWLIPLPHYGQKQSHFCLRAPRLRHPRASCIHIYERHRAAESASRAGDSKYATTSLANSGSHHSKKFPWKIVGHRGVVFRCRLFAPVPFVSHKKIALKSAGKAAHTERFGFQLYRSPSALRWTTAWSTSLIPLVCVLVCHFGDLHETKQPNWGSRAT